MQKKFIRLNTNDNYLSFGNLFRVIKEESNISSTFLQADLFSIIFDTYNIADSTVNNYCTGFRAINPKYKNYYKDLQLKFEKDETSLVHVISKIVDLIDSNPASDRALSIHEINKNLRLKRICNRLYSISKNDSNVPVNFSNALRSYLEKCELYIFMAKVLFFVILEKKQPIFISEHLNDVVEKSIYDTNISVNNIHDFIKIQLNAGIWSLRGLIEFAKNNNPFACFEIASLEFYGIIAGKPRYDKAYKYYMVAAKNNHPVATWAIGYLYYQGYIGTKSKHNLFLAFKYFNKARKLNCSNAFNSLGVIILNGNIPHIKPNKTKAIQMFEKAINMGNVYAYNNLGKIYEKGKDFKKAFDCYMVSADLSESWAANKIGEFYRKGIFVSKDLNKAFNYYLKASESPALTLCYWSKYNLAKHFYLNGCLEIGLSKNVNKAIELLEDIADNLIDACYELIYIYYNLYLEDNKNPVYLDKINTYKYKCESSPNYNAKIKTEIEKTISKIKNTTPPINIL